MSTTVDYVVRRYDDSDEQAVLALLTASLGRGPAGQRPVEFFRWKHIDNPFGRSFMIVAEDRGEIIGLRAFMRWQFEAGDTTVKAVRAVDTATHPAHQGKGIFKRLTLGAIDMMRDEADFIFNTPNEKSLPGYIKMGWQIVGGVPISIRPARPLSLIARTTGLKKAPNKSSTQPSIEPSTPSATEETAGVEKTLLPPKAVSSDDRLTTQRTPEYLAWRYQQAPLLNYQTAHIGDATAIYRLRPRGRFLEATICELLTNDPKIAKALIREVRRVSEADYLAAHFAEWTVAARALRSTGFIRAPKRLTFVARPLRAAIAPDPTLFSSWNLSTGDLEVF